MSNAATPRVDVTEALPDVTKAVYRLHAAVTGCGLEESLLNLVFLRSSQLNGCAYCLDMHTLDALATGEEPRRLTVLDAWREAPFYSDRERAALALAEAVTLVADGHVPDDVYESARAVLGDADLARVVMATTLINMWNRIAISSRMAPGQYTPGQG